jgi:hypothetical protein
MEDLESMINSIIFSIQNAQIDDWHWHYCAIIPYYKNIGMERSFVFRDSYNISETLSPVYFGDDVVGYRVDILSTIFIKILRSLDCTFHDERLSKVIECAITKLRANIIKCLEDSILYGKNFSLGTVFNKFDVELMINAVTGGAGNACVGIEDFDYFKDFGEALYEGDPDDFRKFSVLLETIKSKIITIIIGSLCLASPTTYTSFGSIYEYIFSSKARKINEIFTAKDYTKSLYSQYLQISYEYFLNADLNRENFGYFIVSSTDVDKAYISDILSHDFADSHNGVSYVFRNRIEDFNLDNYGRTAVLYSISLDIRKEYAMNMFCKILKDNNFTDDQLAMLKLKFEMN